MDKASLYEMSYAFMRRFAFIPISVPRVIDKSVVEILLQKWEVEHYQYVEELVTIWKSINKIRPIGPAIVEDIVNYTQVDPDFTSAIILYVLPQFEGLLDYEIKSFFNEISDSEKIDYKRLSQFATDFFHLQERSEERRVGKECKSR